MATKTASAKTRSAPEKTGDKTEEKAKKGASAKISGNGNGNGAAKIAATADGAISAAVTASGGLRAEQVSIDLIAYSTTNPRKFFDETKLGELADSIKVQGVVQPILIRPKKAETGELFELVAGERRLRAARIAGLSEIPSVIRGMTDDEAFEIQIQENLQRVDISPMEEARSYKRLQEMKGWDDDELASRVCKPLRYVLERKILNTLIVPAQEDLAAERITLGHAIEIAKFPQERQQDLLDLCFPTKWNSKENCDLPFKDEGPVPLKKFQGKIQTEILFDLRFAPFGMDDERLRDDGLTCTLCPARSGANPSLFEDFVVLTQDGKAPLKKQPDRCLNTQCYRAKLLKHILLLREEVSKDYRAKNQVMNYAAPLLTTQYSSESEVVKQMGALTPYEFAELKNEKDVCEKAETAIWVHGEEIGKTATVCRAKDCPKHARARSETPGAPKSQETVDLEKRIEYVTRKEELFDIKVGEEVRQKTLKQAALFRFNESNWIWDDAKWRAILIHRVWEQTEGHVRKMIKEMLGIPDSKLSPGYGTTIESWTKALAEIGEEKQSQLLFLAVVGHWGEMRYSSWADQSLIRGIAEEFGVDYRLEDARVRHEKASKINKDRFYEYLRVVRDDRQGEGATARTPRGLLDREPKPVKEGVAIKEQKAYRNDRFIAEAYLPEGWREEQERLAAERAEARKTQPQAETDAGTDYDEDDELDENFDSFHALEEPEDNRLPASALTTFSRTDADEASVEEPIRSIVNLNSPAEHFTEVPEEFEDYEDEELDRQFASKISSD